MNVTFAVDNLPPELTLNGGGDAYALQESGGRVESLSNLVESGVGEGGEMLTPLKGETPPSGRRAQLIRRMTTATKGNSNRINSNY